jgi:hypothetical protein
MKTKTKSAQNLQFNSKLDEIVELYQNTSLATLVDELIKVGSDPEVGDKKRPYIDTIPLPERKLKLKEIIIDIITTAKDVRLKNLI